MSKRRSAIFDSNKPALVVQHGNTEQRHRVLENTGTTLGQARGCDIQLDAPDISGIHCIIVRGPATLELRDCNSRSGTRVNGSRVREAVLHDSDIVQIGPFSFQVYLPAVALAVGAETPSRAATSSNPEKSEPKDATATNREKELEEKQRQIDEANQQVLEGRRILMAENKRLEAKLQQAEQNRLKRESQVEEALQARVRECQERCEQMEREIADRLQRLPSPDQARDFQIRQKELDDYARHLKSISQHLREQQEVIKQELSKDQTEATARQAGGPGSGQVQALLQIARQQEEALQLQKTMQERHDGLAQVVAELRTLQSSACEQQGNHAEVLRQVHQILQNLASRGEVEQDRQRPSCESSCEPKRAEAPHAPRDEGKVRSAGKVAGTQRLRRLEPRQRQFRGGDAE